MKKKTIVSLVIAGIILLVLFSPIPFRQGPVICLPCSPDPDNSKCNCPHEGDWSWRASIAVEIYHILFSNTSQTAVPKNGK